VQSTAARIQHCLQCCSNAAAMLQDFCKKLLHIQIYHIHILLCYAQQQLLCMAQQDIQ
jgi:hypothetical protein